MAALYEKIKEQLPISLQENCCVGSFRGGCLTLIASNAGFATELRYHLPDLRDSLRKAGFYQLSSIKIALAEKEQNSLLPSSTLLPLTAQEKRKRKYNHNKPLEELLTKIRSE